MSDQTFTIAVTGGNGYVGSVILKAIRAQGWRGISLQRSAGDQDTRRFSLGEPLPPETLAGVDVLVHCAYDFKAYGWEEIRKSNVDGSMALFRAAQAAGVKRLILISSISAFDGCTSLYGKAKLELEKQAAAIGAIIVRPGLVYGAGPGGMMGALAKLANLPLFMPIVGSGNQLQYLVHEADLGDVFVRLAKGEVVVKEPIIAACDRPLTLKQIMQSLSGGRKKILLPIPWRLLWAGLKSLETVGLRPRTRSDSLVSLMNQNPSPDFKPLHAITPPLRPFTNR